MVSVDANGDELESSSAPPVLQEYHIRIPSLQETLIEQRTSSKRRWLLDFLGASPCTDWLKHLTTLRQILDHREQISLSVPSPAGIALRRRRRFFRTINWPSLLQFCKEWLENPMNIALLVWLTCVAASAAMLGLLLLGLLDRAFPTKALRNHWIEINNQVLNALFTLMSLYEHPVLFYHLFLLCRWSSVDVVALRKIYCKNGARRPREWVHISVVLALLHLTCFAQYTSCALYWEYSRRQRPEFLDDLFFGVGLAAPAIASLYTVYSPLGRDWEDSDHDEESQASIAEEIKCQKNETAAVSSPPQWAGGLLEFRDDATVCCLSCFCTCCVFGWNMERLGFGNMYVHAATFLLLCIAPFWIFNISALNIHDYVVGDAVGAAGVVLCAFGLLYGGYWRVQMRRRLGLPGDAPGDYARWMFCWSCSLAQEVRTANSHEVEDGGQPRKASKSGKDESVDSALTTPPIPPLMQLKDVVGEQLDSVQLPPAKLSGAEEEEGDDASSFN